MVNGFCHYVSRLHRKDGVGIFARHFSSIHIVGFSHHAVFAQTCGAVVGASDEDNLILHRVKKTDALVAKGFQMLAEVGQLHIVVAEVGALITVEEIVWVDFGVFGLAVEPHKGVGWYGHATHIVDDVKGATLWLLQRIVHGTINLEQPLFDVIVCNQIGQ